MNKIKIFNKKLIIMGKEINLKILSMKKSYIIIRIL